jgi:2'-hydroxyisoflavone reductase
MSNRREFLRHAAAASSVLAFGATQAGANTGVSRSLRVLFLGGTGFIGPHHVRAAVARGHQVAVFNRGKSEAELPASVERLVGDRNRDLEAIRNRDWDAVVDLAAYGPGWVRSLGEALRERVGHYTFVSAIAVYDHPPAHEVTRENARVLAYQGRADPYQVSTRTNDYGALKVLCEREAEAQFPGKTLVLRPGYIAGPGDQHGALTYLALRAQRGGEMLMASEPSAPAQYIDVRDMAEWAMRMVEKSATGIYNTVGPEEPGTCEELINAAGRAVSVSVKPAWVPASWLAEQRDSREMWGQVLFWHSLADAGLMRMGNERAVQAGLTLRAPRDTVADILSWHRTLPAEAQGVLVTGRKRKHDGSGSVPVTASWASYLEREKQILGEWRARAAMNAAQ